MRIMNRIAAASAVLFCLSACGEGNNDEVIYEDAYAEGYAEAEAEGAQKIAELTELIEGAQSSIADARSAASATQNAATNVAREANGFSYQDWEYVVPSVQSAASDVEAAAQELSGHLDDAEASLSIP